MNKPAKSPGHVQACKASRRGDPTLTIVAEQLYDNGQVHTHHIRVDVMLLLQAASPGVLLKAAALEALANIGVKK